MTWDTPTKNDTSNADVEQFKPKTELLNSMKTQDFEEFVFEDEEDTEKKKEIFSVYGHKNDGKTTISYGIPHEGDKILVFSFDNKSTRPKDADYITSGNLNIKVINAIKYLDKSSDVKYIETSQKTHAFLISMISQSKDKFAPDWIMIDGTEVMSSIMELVMRGKNNLRPYQGIANLSLWKERRQYIDDIHKRVVETSSKGVIYTMYSQKDEIIDDGGVISRKDVPRWIGSVMEETDVVIHAESKFENNKKTFYAKVESSKIPINYPDGIYKVTNKRFRDVITASLI